MTWEEVEKLSTCNVIVQAWMTLYRADRVTKEQCLCGALLALAEYANKLNDSAIALRQSQPFNLVIGGVTIGEANP